MKSFVLGSKICTCGNSNYRHPRGPTRKSYSRSGTPIFETSYCRFLCFLISVVSVAPCDPSLNDEKTQIGVTFRIVLTCPRNGFRRIVPQTPFVSLVWAPCTAGLYGFLDAAHSTTTGFLYLACAAVCENESCEKPPVT